jgi:hypothetical protein
MASLARVSGQLPPEKARPALFDLINPIHVTLQKLFNSPPNTVS